MEKRICLLAGYDKNNTIEDYVVFLVQELSKISDVYYFADGEIPAAELDKIRPYTEYAESAPHKKRFGAVHGKRKISGGASRRFFKIAVSHGRFGARFNYIGT